MKRLQKILATILVMLMVWSVVLVPISSSASQADDIVAAARSFIGSQAYNGYCLAFCRKCYEIAGLYSSYSPGTALEAGNAWVISTSSTNIPAGACVFFDTSWSPYGHVGIYIGNGQMIDAESQYGGVQVRNFKTKGYRGWGWYGGVAPSGSTSNPPSSSNNYANIAAGDYSIICKSGGCYLNVLANPGQAANKKNVCISNADGTNEQKFRIEALGNSKYLIRSLSNSNYYCVDIATSSTSPASGTNVQVYSNTAFASKHWYFEDVGGGYYVIRSVLNPNLVLTAVNNVHRSNVVVQTYSGADTQKWRLDNLNKPAVTLSSISVASNPSVMTYTVGDTLNTSGLTIKLSYSDGSSKNITSGFSCSPTTLNTVGSQTITVTYSGKTTSFSVTVNPKPVTLSKISVATSPTKTTYVVGEKLDTSGLTLNATYSDGSVKKISSGFSCNPTTLSTAGKTTITVTYQGKTTTFDVNVEKKSVVSLSVNKLPEKTSYYIGESLDSAGLEIKVDYNDGSSEIIKEGFTCKVDDFTKEGTYYVDVQYSGKIIAFEVTVSTAPTPIDSIRIDQMPNKMEYIIGEDFDPNGIEVIVRQSDGTETELTECTYSPKKMETVGMQKMTVTYLGKTTEFYVTVYDTPAIDTQNYEITLESGIMGGELCKYLCASSMAYFYYDPDEGADVQMTVTPDMDGIETPRPADDSDIIIFDQNGNEMQIYTCHLIYPDLDYDNDSYVTTDDAVYLLKSSMLPEMYPVSGRVDFDKDGYITTDDAVYLLKHTMLPEMYPIY